MAIKSFTLKLQNYSPSEVLQLLGPRFKVRIELTDDQANGISKSGGTIPAAITGYAIIDTASPVCGLDLKVIEKLGLKSTDLTDEPIAYWGERKRREVYAVDVSFNDDLDKPWVKFTRAIGMDLNPLTKADDPYGLVMIIGRDALIELVMIYDGRTGQVTIAC